jgi:gamma-glutamyltranspeptidase/glutathione hydrolase
MAYAVENYGSGKMKLADLIQPAVDLAKNGFWMGPTTSSCLENNYNNLLKYPEFGKVYLLDEATAEQLDRPIYATGDKFTNPDQVKTLELIQELGPDAFYNGEITDAMINVINKYGGVFIKDDFANYTAKEKQPVEGEFMGKKIISTPLPSSGGTCICQILNIMEAYGTDKLKEYGHNSAMYLHVLQQAMALTYADRGVYLYDYGEEVEKERAVMDALTSKEYAKYLASLITEDGMVEAVAHDPFEFEHQDTVSYSVADKEGNIVTVTFTVNGIFGAKLIPDGYGFILNNEMDDFNKNPYHPGHIAPGKYPLSSMSPTIVLNENGTPFMTVGSPGATTIIVAVAQAILNVTLWGMEATDAVNAPRVWGTGMTLNYENRIDPAVIEKVAAMGHEVKDSGEWPPSAGSVQCVVYDSDGKLHSAADPRRDCKAWAF